MKDESGVDKIYYGLVDESLRLNSLRSRAALRPSAVGRDLERAIIRAEDQLEELKKSLVRLVRKPKAEGQMELSLKGEWESLKQKVQEIEERMMAETK